MFGNMSSNTVYRLIVIFEGFPFNKISGLEFRKFHVPDATVPKPLRICLLFLYNNFVKCKGTFQSYRPKWPDRSKLVPNIPVGPNEMVSSIWCTNRNFRNFTLNGKRPLFRIPGWKSMGGVWSSKPPLTWIDNSVYFTFQRRMHMF